MAPHRLMIAFCFCVIAAGANSASIHTQDEHIVVASEQHKVRRSIDTSTDRPYDPIKLTEMRVRSEVALRYARTSVITHVINPDMRPQEASFHMLLPDTAFISGFTMITDGKSYKAYVKEKQEAKQMYTQAVSQGSGAAHIATKARDSNHFTVSVNVEGNTTAVFDLRYEDFLVSRNGLYSHIINLHPGALVPTMEVVVHIKESQKITKLHVPEVRTGNEIEAKQNDAQNSKVVIQNGTNENEVTITFTPDLAEQRRLAKIYRDKSQLGSSSTALGQFVVEYDVERSNNGEILLNDGYFVHFLAPTSLPPLSKHVVFVLDTSYSMYGGKIEQLRKAMDVILSDLHPNDYFNIVEFNSVIKIYELKDDESLYTHTSSASAVPPAPASAANIAKAKVIASRLNISGATNINDALEAALSLVKKSVEQKNEKIDTENDNEPAEIKIQMEPIIIFLTDGEPNVGQSDPNQIISHITKMNSGEIRAALYSLAFGDNADRTFLRKLSLRNEGFMRHIYMAADAALQLQDFYRQVSSPLLANVKFQYPKNQVKEESVSLHNFRTINAGSEVAVVGQLADDVTEITPRIVGFSGIENEVGWNRYEVAPEVVVNSTKDEHMPLERLWAYLTIKQLLDKRAADGDHSTDENSPEKKALAIALKYSFVTPLTSLVVVKPNETYSVDVEPAEATSTPAWVSPSQSAAPPVWSAPADWGYGANRRGGWFQRNLIGNGQHNRNTVYYGGSDNDDYVRFNPARRITAYRPFTSVPATITTTSTSTQTPTTASNVNYHLEGFEWTSSMLNSSTGALTVLGENGTQVILQLATDVDPPKADAGDKECSKSTFAVGANENVGRVCVYLTRCYAARTITSDDYQKSYCIVNNRYAGVCCPRDDVDRKP
ncbi:inter-alpha-trypsin inhibitor heavy chain H4-like isoform X2 [Pararge aegeria]|uniref:inter-alpha-trypsin inhibitor heavy chain H4-like isoform X2 n=1 Tax=Pararge aegeria TaxID=116150 RepID=UPI0019D0582E|nr:inter-alpha-trypsin inhibitor heavy chain H4-like isoform X2 [Pararge aegeria]